MSRPKTRAREERIYTLDELEVRAAEDGKPPRIAGRAIVYNRWSEDLGGFRERIMPGALAKTLAESDVRMLWQHDPRYVLGRNTSGTLTFDDTPTALRIDNTPPETDLVRDMVLTPMLRGDVNQMSFAFRTIRDEWREPKKVGDLWERDVHEMAIRDVSVVTFPAYVQSSAAVRDQLGLLEVPGLDLPALTALLTRAERGLPLTDSDIDLINGSIELLRSYLPGASEPDEGHHPPAEPEPREDGHHSAPGRQVSSLLRLIELEAAELAIAS